uniref:Calmodulin-2/4-like n=1 Tax=Ciona intestinalis TaxID=7719 RepID=F6ZDT9_CIOIN|nr:calmodulin-2/4-like [Ciona intestinalis]|eukprot:XP_002122118.1 calmodulin-2/4-like [Ciona intestinalis]
MTSRPTRTSVQARLHQIESANATKEHLSKNPNIARKNDASDDVSSDDDTFAFGDLVKALTSEGTSSGGMSETDALKEAFKILDCDEDGYITLSDLRVMMSEFDDVSPDDVSEEDLVEMIAAADLEGKGRIDFKSFVNVLKSKEKDSKEKKKSTSSKTE